MPARTEKRGRRARPAKTADANVISIVEVLDARRTAEANLRLQRAGVAPLERYLEQARADLREAERRRDGLRRGAGGADDGASRN